MLKFDSYIHPTRITKDAPVCQNSPDNRTPIISAVSVVAVLSLLVFFGFFIEVVGNRIREEKAEQLCS